MGGGDDANSVMLGKTKDPGNTKQKFAGPLNFLHKNWKLQCKAPAGAEDETFRKFKMKEKAKGLNDISPLTLSDEIETLDSNIHGKLNTVGEQCPSMQNLKPRKDDWSKTYYNYSKSSLIDLAKIASTSDDIDTVVVGTHSHYLHHLAKYISQYAEPEDASFWKQLEAVMSRSKIPNGDVLSFTLQCDQESGECKVGGSPKLFSHQDLQTKEGKKFRELVKQEENDSLKGKVLA